MVVHDVVIRHRQKVCHVSSGRMWGIAATGHGRPSLAVVCCPQRVQAGEAGGDPGCDTWSGWGADMRQPAMQGTCGSVRLCDLRRSFARKLTRQASGHVLPACGAAGTPVSFMDVGKNCRMGLWPSRDLQGNLLPERQCETCRRASENHRPPIR